MEEVRDIISADGIYKNGFGTVAKIVIGNTKLNIGAKGLYCYLCSYAGAGDTAFPYKYRLCEELGISDKTYLKYINELIENNLIEKHQVKKGTQFSYNHYTIRTSIKLKNIKEIIKENEKLFKKDLDNDECFEEIENIDICGYGKIPKSLTKDENISIKAKALFGLISAHYKYGYKPINSKLLIKSLDISENTYYKILKELVDNEYIIEKEIKTKKSYTKKVFTINIKREYKENNRYF